MVQHAHEDCACLQVVTFCWECGVFVSHIKNATLYADVTGLAQILDSGLTIVALTAGANAVVARFACVPVVEQARYARGLKTTFRAMDMAVRLRRLVSFSTMSWEGTRARIIRQCILFPAKWFQQTV